MTGVDLAPVHLGTGELLERLDEQPAETLAEALALVLEREAEAKRWHEALEAELRNRLKIRQTRLAVFGEWEVEASISRESVWDWDELEGVMRQLVDDGVIQAKDATGIIYRETTGYRAAAKRLASILTGDAKAAVEATCTWKEKPGKLNVVRSVQLPAPAPADPSPAGDGRTPGAASGRVSAPAPTPTLDPKELFA
jgi:hypothetical protein